MLEIWKSFRRMPVWVQVWVACILAPINIATLYYVSQPYGILVAILAIGGMAPNIFIMNRERGLSKAMAIPHVIVWPILLCVIAGILATQVGLSPAHLLFLQLLFAIDFVSLCFDVPETRAWLKGDRAIA